MRKSKSRREEKKKEKKRDKVSQRKTPEAEPSAQVEQKAAEVEPIAEPEDRTRKLEALNRELQEKKEQLEDRLLRLAAEFDNYRKRMAREFQQVVENANRDLIVQLIDVLDNFQRALDSAKNARDFDAFHQGVELIYGHLYEILARQGLKPIEAVGQPFDPHLHEAIMLVDDDQHPPETVVSQTQPGYLLGDRLLRAPRVIVSRNTGGAETAAGGKEQKIKSTAGSGLSGEKNDRALEEVVEVDPLAVDQKEQAREKEEGPGRKKMSRKRTARREKKTAE
jgi:molecular chaperone GrpE